MKDKSGAIDVMNTEQVILRLRKVNLLVSTKIMRRGLKKAAAVVHGRAERAAPVGDPNDLGYRRKTFSRLPGVLRRSIVVKARKTKGAIVFFVVVEDEAFYARFLELGTKYMNKKEWMGPALRRARRPAIRALARKIHGDLNRMESMN